MITRGHRRHRQVRRPRADDGLRSRPLRRLRRRRRGIDGRSRQDGRARARSRRTSSTIARSRRSAPSSATSRRRASSSPWTCGCAPAPRAAGSRPSLDAVGRYYREWADPWERQTLTRARLVGGDPRVGRAVRRVIRDLLYGPEASPPDLKEMRELRDRMERELGKESAGRLHVKFGRGGLVDVEFITQALVMTPRRAAPVDPARQHHPGHRGHPARRAPDRRRRGGAGRALPLPPPRLGRAPPLRRPPVGQRSSPRGRSPAASRRASTIPRARSSSRTTAAARPGSARSTTGSSPRAERWATSAQDPCPQPPRRGGASRAGRPRRAGSRKIESTGMSEKRRSTQEPARRGSVQGSAAAGMLWVRTIEARASGIHLALQHSVE